MRPLQGRELFFLDDIILTCDLYSVGTAAQFKNENDP